MNSRATLQAHAARWTDVAAAERANYQLYLTELAEALEVPGPQPAGSGYQFELPVRMVNPDGTTTTRFADLVKDGHFLLEAKDAEVGRSTDLLLRRAFGQAVQYASVLRGSPPPYRAGAASRSAGRAEARGADRRRTLRGIARAGCLCRMNVPALTRSLSQTRIANARRLPRSGTSALVSR